MCDYSLMIFPNRLAREGEQLVVHQFSSGAKGLASPLDLRPAPIPFPAPRKRFWSRLSFLREPKPAGASSIKPVPAVCVPPGARLLVWDLPESLRQEIRAHGVEEVAFTQINAEPGSFRDALHFANGETVLIQKLREGQRLLVLGLSSTEVIHSNREALAVAG
jgi:hypothetical protein